MEYIANLPNKVQAVNAILNQGNETKEEREERRRVIREIKSGLKTKEEKEQAERRIQEKNKALRARLEIEVHAFEKDQKKAVRRFLYVSIVGHHVQISTLTNVGTKCVEQLSEILITDRFSLIIAQRWQ
ncbi:Protein CBG15644 [Caenorhabditis briggsae]|uniref:Protein CBG15644 n=1 Tax=Caenorhabditis briggsae TaxID=6238 RepID=A8XMG1_CAEBR|nr:Protein CBG15644 [Caenorhabditis briggsae]CAP33837.1 Protein CBG15644 [Caenorhabditis briggsae]